jgi:hypothetical protein
MKSGRRGGRGKPMAKDGGMRKQIATVMTKEEIMEKSTTDQIVMIEELAEKITSNPEENVDCR